MKQSKRIQELMTTLGDFIALHDIDPENVEGLMSYMTSHKLEFTSSSLLLAHKALSEQYWEEHPDEKPEENPVPVPTLTLKDIEGWTADEFKTQMTNPKIAEEVNAILSKKV